MKVMKKKVAMKAMKVMKKKAVTSMPKSGIAAAIAEETALKKSDVSKVLASLTDVATQQVTKAGKFAIPGLVMLKKKVKPARARQEDDVRQRGESEGGQSEDHREGL